MEQVRSWWRILMLLMTVLDCVLDLNLKTPQQLFSAIGGQVWIPAYTGLKPESGVLECSFRKPNITKEDVIILCNIGSSGCVSSPYKGRLDIFLSNFTLHLKNVREEDSGTYKCALKRPNSTSVITSSYLQVHDTISDLRVIYTYEKSRNTATFLCEFSGDYENITWKKDGKIVFSDLWPVNVKSLIIRKVDTSDSGRYSCIVGTRFGAFKNESEFKLPFSDLKMYMFGLDVSSLTLSCLCFLCIIYVSCIPEDATIIIIRKAGFVTYKLFSVINVALFIFMLALWNTQGSLVAASMMVPFTIGFVPVLACFIMDFCTCTKCTENELFLGVADISPHVMNLVILFGSITAICELSTREFGDPHPAWILSVFGTVGIFLCVSLGVYRCCIYCRDRPRPKTSDEKEQGQMILQSVIQHGTADSNEKLPEKSQPHPKYQYLPQNSPKTPEPVAGKS